MLYLQEDLVKRTDGNRGVSRLRDVTLIRSETRGERLRENSTLSNTVFILVSGELTPTAFVRYDCYLRKPVAMEKLFAVVDRLLHHSGRHFGTISPKSDKR